MPDYSIHGNVYASADPALQATLAKVHGNRDRPRCMCIHDGVEMYVAKHGDSYLIKRMPDSAGNHSPHCDSYEPPAELSGLGEVLGHAIKEDVESGAVTLKFDFALTRSSGRQPPEPSGSPADTVKADSRKLTLRSVLHYLWDEAGLTKWAPRMEGRRSWSVIHRHINLAAIGKTTKGSALGASLYLPEPYFVDRKDEIARARNTRFADVQTATKGTRKLMILVGEVKEVAKARYGYKVIIKQLPDCPFMLDESIFKRMEKRFESELTLWEAFNDSHLMAIATFGVAAAGIPEIEELSLMLTTVNWIPFDNKEEKELIDRLTERSRHFVKGMRYNLDATREIASAVLTDTQPKPVALHLSSSKAEGSDLAESSSAEGSSSLGHWEWDVKEASMPELPAQAPRINSARTSQ